MSTDKRCCRQKAVGLGKRIGQLSSSQQNCSVKDPSRRSFFRLGRSEEKKEKEAGVGTYRLSTSQAVSAVQSNPEEISEAL